MEGKMTDIVQTDLQKEFLQWRLDWTQDPGRGEYLQPSPFGEPPTFDFAEANHYKILYRTCDFIITGRGHYLEFTEDRPPTLEEVEKFLIGVHPYFAWVMADEQAHKELERLFWLHYECQTDWDLPPEIVAKQEEKRKLEQADCDKWRAESDRRMDLERQPRPKPEKQTPRSPEETLARIMRRMQ
jgi:hypothetical protein